MKRNPSSVSQAGESTSGRRSYISYDYRAASQDGSASQNIDAAAKKLRHEKQRSVPQIVQRRVVPGCEPIFCWGLHAGREWVIAAANAGFLSVLCSGAAGASSQNKSFSLWQTIDLRRHEGRFAKHKAPQTPPSGEQQAPANIETTTNYEKPSSTETEAKDEGQESYFNTEFWKVTALAWCKPPSAKLGAHPLDPDAPYCAAFAVGTYGRVSIFNPTERNSFEWELISVLEPAGSVLSLTWAPEGRHLVSGGTQLILWSPEANAIGPSGASSIAGSVYSMGSAGFTSANTERNHAKLLASRSPALNGGSRRSPSSPEDEVKNEPRSYPRTGSSYGGEYSTNDGCDDDVDLQSEPYNDGDERIALFDASWILEEAEDVITLVDFSADCRMFASVSEHSLEVRVWFEGDSLFGNMDYLSLFHPREVLSLQWRLRADGHSYHVRAQHSHTPQSLVTLCADHIVRIWQESDPQTEELAMFVAIHIDTRHRPLRSIGWLQFINYFEGLRSPFPEHNMYTSMREDFIVGFNSASTFFQSHAHQTTIWGEHQTHSVELRTGPIAQESQSSLDWLTAVDQAGQVCMWSLEGLSDSPRRDIHILPWNKSCAKVFTQVDVGGPNQNPFVLRRPDDVYLTRRLSGMSDDELLQYEAREGFFEEMMNQATSEDAWNIYAHNSFIATCRVTQEFDPHTERDPWPSTCVFDVNPRNIETLSFGESGLVYSFAENDAMKMNSAYGTVTHMTLCIAQGHVSDIFRIGYERVIDVATNYSVLEEAYWVTTVDKGGVAVTWPVRSGSREEEVDADALIRSGSISLPMRGQVVHAIVTEVAPFHLLCLIVDQDDQLFVWQRVGAMVHEWSQIEVSDEIHSACGTAGGCVQDVFAVRDGNYLVHFGIHVNNGCLIFLPAKEILRPEPSVDLGAIERCEFPEPPLCIAPVAEKQLYKHGVLALVAMPNGRCILQGLKQGHSPQTSFEMFPSDKTISVASAANGEIVTVHESGAVHIWAPRLCHMQYRLQTTIRVQDDVLGPCLVKMASALYLGAGVSVLGIGIHEQSEHGERVAKVLLYSRARTEFRLVASDEQIEYTLLGSTRAALRRSDLVGIAWSGRDFGLIAATSTQIHLFQGWLRYPPVGDIAKELSNIRRRKQLEHKGVASSLTGQLESINGIGDSAVAMQLPLALHHPRPILELLRAGCVKPVRAILKTILNCLEARKQENEDAYGTEDTPPRSAMLISPPNVALHEIVREIWNETDNQMNPASASNMNQNTSATNEGSSNDTAAALFADDDWSMGGMTRATGGAASALFDEDPWDSMISSTAVSTTLSDPTAFSEREVSALSELLTLYTIKGLKPSEQLQLTALSGVFDNIYGMKDDDKAGFGDSVDACGAKFMLSFELYQVSKRVLPPSERPRAMPSADLLWALESDSQDALLSKCLPSGECTWEDAKRIGVGLWLRSQHAARVLAEDIAKTQFKEDKSRDPFSCALFYFALNKASVVSGLFKLAKNTKAAELLANDFTDEHWQEVAVKNAFSLLRKQKYLEAASFFVLGNRLQEATNICIKNLGDFQLAIFLCKLVEGADGEVQRSIWEYTIKPLALYVKDSWLTSMCHTVAGDHAGAVLAFVENQEAFLDEQVKAEVDQKTQSETKPWGYKHNMSWGAESLSGGSATSDPADEYKIEFDDLNSFLRKGVVNKELLEKLSKTPFPSLTRAFNSLEPDYIRTLISSASKQSSLLSLKQSGAMHRVLHESMGRAAKHAAAMGIPLLSLLTLQTIESGLCTSCIEQTRLRLAAQVLHPLLLKAHASTEDERGDDVPPNGWSVVLSPEAVSDLQEDLDAVNKQLAKCPPRDILESLWRISRASNHIAAELTVIRMLRESEPNAFLVRLQQVLHSIMDSYVALGQGNASLGVSTERTLLPARRLASYAILLIDLATSVDKIMQVVPLVPGLEEIRLSSRTVDSDTKEGENDVEEDPVLQVAELYSRMFEAYARVALFAAAFAMKQLGLVQALLQDSFSMESIRETGLKLARTWFDYEELLIYSTEQPFKFTTPGLYDTIDEDSPDDDMIEWGLTYAERLMMVAVTRSMLKYVINVRDQISTIHNMYQDSGPQSPKSPGSPTTGASPTEKIEHPAEYCLELMEELVQSCWPVNWSMLSNLYLTSVPIGLSEQASQRLEQMKVQAFADEEKSSLWNSVKGKEQLRIVDATARWTGRSIDQEHARSGIIPDSTIFCTDNSKVVHSRTGALVLSVDPIHALDGTLVIASESGCEVIRHSFDDQDDDDGDCSGAASEDEGYLPFRAHRSMQLPRSPVSAAVESNTQPASRMGHARFQSQPETVYRTRRRSISDEALPTFSTAESQESSRSLMRPGRLDSSASTNSSRLLSSRGVILHAAKIRRPHIRLRRNAHKRAAASNRSVNSIMHHSWRSSAKSLLMVSESAGQIWFNESLRMPLNNNLYCDSFQHRVSSHTRVEALLQSSRSLGVNAPGPFGEHLGSGRSRLPSNLSIRSAKKSEESVRAVMHVTSHPFLPLYVTAQYDGSAVLWDANKESDEPVVRLHKPSDDVRKWKAGHTTRVRISDDGMRFAACDSAGHVLLWNLADCRDNGNYPFGQFACHSKRALDLAFLNYNGNIFASAGQGQHSENLCLWDLSMPPRSCRVASVHCCSHSVAYSLAYLQDQQVVIVGGGNGQIGVFDLRQRMLILEEDHVHSKAIRSLAVHPTGGSYFASGSTDGSVKLWSYRSGRLASHAHLQQMHPTHMFVNELTSDSILSQRGTTDVAFSRDFLYSCGADGTVKMTPLSSLAL